MVYRPPSVVRGRRNPPGKPAEAKKEFARLSKNVDAHQRNEEADVTELIWEGKYKDGKKVAPLRVALPFQTVETVNESAADRERTLNLFGAGRDTEWRNRLIWGDKKYVLPSLLPEFAGKVDLIYIDPPFDTGANFSYIATVPDDPETVGDQSATFVKEPSIIEQKAYRDTWGRGLDSYLKWFYETGVLLRDMLASDGSLYVHLDWHVGHYAKVVLDEVFGPSCFRSEIIWKRTTSHSDASTYGSVHDTILFYANSGFSRLNAVTQKYDPEYLETYYRYVDASGRRFMSADLTGAGPGPARKFGDKVIAPPTGRHWIYDQTGIDRAMKDDRVFWTRNGVPRLKRYFDDADGMPATDLWADIQALRSWHAEEQTTYATQKPEALLRRILDASSEDDDLVLDCFCGSGTTAAVAEKLNRRWIACDLGRFAIHTTRKRLLGIEGVRPFVVQNLGKYERQQWQAAEFGPNAQRPAPTAELAYRCFILDLYRARPLSGYVWLHGVKNGRMVHVGAVDSPVSVGDVQQIALEFRRAMGTGAEAPTTNGVDVLGWDFAFEMNEVARQQAALANIDVRFLRIPREVLEKKAVEQGDIRFFELAALSVNVEVQGRTAKLALSDFVIPTDEVPEDVQKAITHWSQWIDYWAVDWDNKNDTFHNEWQSYRTRKNRDMERTASKVYEKTGDYSVVVKVIDILGNDTTKTIRVKVG